MLESHNIGMRILDELAHNLQLSILESLVLQDLLDGYDFPCLHHFGFKDDTKRSISNDSFSGIRDILLC